MRGLASVCLQAYKNKRGKKQKGSRYEGGEEVKKGKDEAERGSGQRERESFG